MKKYIALFEEFIKEEEGGLDLGGLGGDPAGGGKEKEVDPEKEIEKAKKKEKKEEDAARKKVVDAAKKKMVKAFKAAPRDFLEKFEKRIKKAVEEDDRVVYHDLITDIQRYQMPLSREGQTEEVEKTGDFIEILQDLNKTEYR